MGIFLITPYWVSGWAAKTAAARKHIDTRAIGLVNRFSWNSRKTRLRNQLEQRRPFIISFRRYVNTSTQIRNSACNIRAELDKSDCPRRSQKLRWSNSNLQ